MAGGLNSISILVGRWMTTNDLLKGLLGRLGVEKIVWVDDRFAEVEDAAYERQIEVLATEIRTNEAGKKRISEVIKGFSDVAPEQIQQKVVADFIRESAGRLRELEDHLKRLTQELGLTVSAQGDLSLDVFEKIVEALDVEVEKYSLAQWRKIPAEKKQQYRSCLFLVDRQFSREGNADNAGDELVYEIGTLGCLDYFCIMFTYTADAALEDATRVEILGKLSDQNKGKPLSPVAASFHVLAKSRLSNEEDAVVNSFAKALEHAFLRSLCARLVGFTHEAMNAGTAETLRGLSNLSIYDVDRSVFLNSLYEGASEVDVIFRLIALGQRRKTEELLARNDDTLLHTLNRLRALQETTKNPLRPVLGKESLVKKWRQDEILVSGEIINRTSAPLACGDIFAKSVKGNEKLKRYVLLCQPCDLMVRHDGSSKGEEGFFVEVIEPDTASMLRGDYKRPYYYSLAYPEGALVFDFREWGSVSLEVLRLAIFNEEGKLALSHKSQAPRQLHLPGWKKLFEKAKQKFRPVPAGGRDQGVPPSYTNLSLNSRISGRNGKGGQAQVEFDFTREMRIRSPYAEAILSAFLSYNARAAFDHDFAATGEPATVAEIPPQADQKVVEVA